MTVLKFLSLREMQKWG